MSYKNLMRKMERLVSYYKLNRYELTMKDASVINHELIDLKRENDRVLKNEIDEKRTAT